MTVKRSEHDAGQPAAPTIAAAALGPAWPCPRCGFDGDELAPGDAAVAARSLSRRWRDLLCGIAGREPAGDAVLHQSLAGGASVLERAGFVAETFRRSAHHLAQVWVHDRPAIDGDDPADSAPEPAETQLDDRVEALSVAAEQLAVRIGAFEGDAWDRAGLRSGQPVGALQLARDAIHEGVHHLRLTRDALAALDELPIEEDDDR